MGNKYCETRENFLKSLSKLEDKRFNILPHIEYDENIKPYDKLDCNIIRLYGVVTGKHYHASQTAYKKYMNENRYKDAENLIIGMERWTDTINNILEEYTNHKPHTILTKKDIDDIFLSSNTYKYNKLNYNYNNKPKFEKLTKEYYGLVPKLYVSKTILGNIEWSIVPHIKFNPNNDIYCQINCNILRLDSVSEWNFYGSKYKFDKVCNANDIENAIRIVNNTKKQLDTINNLLNIYYNEETLYDKLNPSTKTHLLKLINNEPIKSIKTLYKWYS